jgi:hypothetical protein
MLDLPPAAPVTGWRITTRLPHDHYVRVGSSDYSVGPSVIGRAVEVAAGLEERRELAQTGEPRAPPLPRYESRSRVTRAQKSGH